MARTFSPPRRNGVSTTPRETSARGVTVTDEPRLAWTVLTAGKLRVGDSEQMLVSLERNLMNLGYFELVDASHLGQIMEERGIMPPELIDTELAVQLGKLTGIDGIVILQSGGSVTWLWPYSELSYVATAKLIGCEDVELAHVSFGTVLGNDGKPFKTRSGDTVGLEGLLDDLRRHETADPAERAHLDEAISRIGDMV